MGIQDKRPFDARTAKIFLFLVALLVPLVSPGATQTIQLRRTFTGLKKKPFIGINSVFVVEYVHFEGELTKGDPDLLKPPQQLNGIHDQLEQQTCFRLSKTRARADAVLKVVRTNPPHQQKPFLPGEGRPVYSGRLEKRYNPRHETLWQGEAGTEGALLISLASAACR